MNHNQDLAICEAATGTSYIRVEFMHGCASNYRSYRKYLDHFNPAYVTQLIKKAQRCEELERVLHLCIGYLDLDDAHEAHAFNEAKELLK